MIILGIDPGTINLGYSLIQKDGRKFRLIEAGLIKMKTRTLQYQISEMIEGFDMIFKNHIINMVAMEDIFYAHNPKTVLKLAQFRGAVALKICKILET